MVAKFDTGKIRIELVPAELIFGTAQVLTFGANKYGDRNWEQGMSWSRVFGAMMRHMWAWWAGQGPTCKSFVFGDLDEETGVSHLWHASCCLAFLMAYEERAIGSDDRPRLAVPAEPAKPVKPEIRSDMQIAASNWGYTHDWSQGDLK
jgi:hypothetical protein